MADEPEPDNNEEVTRRLDVLSAHLAAGIGRIEHTVSNHQSNTDLENALARIDMLVERISALENVVRQFVERGGPNQAMQQGSGEVNHQAAVQAARDVYLSAAREVFEAAEVRGITDCGHDVVQLVLSVKPYPSARTGERLKAKNALLEKVQAKAPQLVGFFALKFASLEHEA